MSLEELSLDLKGRYYNSKVVSDYLKEVDMGNTDLVLNLLEYCSSCKEWSRGEACVVSLKVLYRYFFCCFVHKRMGGVCRWEAQYYFLKVYETYCINSIILIIEYSIKGLLTGLDCYGEIEDNVSMLLELLSGNDIITEEQYFITKGYSNKMHLEHPFFHSGWDNRDWK